MLANSDVSHTSATLVGFERRFFCLPTYLPSLSTSSLLFFYVYVWGCLFARLMQMSPRKTWPQSEK